MAEYRCSSRYVQYKAQAVACSELAYYVKLFERIRSSSLERNEQNQSDIALFVFTKTVPGCLLPCQALHCIRKAIHATTAQEVLHRLAAANLWYHPTVRTVTVYVEEVCEEAADLKAPEGVVW
jgi:hypothetical protein